VWAWFSSPCVAKNLPHLVGYSAHARCCSLVIHCFHIVSSVIFFVRQLHATAPSACVGAGFAVLHALASRRHPIDVDLIDATHTSHHKQSQSFSSEARFLAVHICFTTGTAQQIVRPAGPMTLSADGMAQRLRPSESLTRRASAVRWQGRCCLPSQRTACVACRASTGKDKSGVQEVCMRGVVWTACLQQVAPNQV
jgi:hypothetical protein